MPHPVNKKIRNLLTEHDYSQRAIAEKLSISQGAVNQRLNSKISFNVDDIVIIARTLKISIEDILEDVLEYSPEDHHKNMTRADFFKFRDGNFQRLTEITLELKQMNRNLIDVIKSNS